MVHKSGFTTLPDGTKFAGWASSEKDRSKAIAEIDAACAAGGLTRGEVETIQQEGGRILHLCTVYKR